MVQLAVDCKSATWFNPLNGEISNACFHNDSIAITLRSGESMILETFDKQLEGCQKEVADKRQGKVFVVEGPWTLSFIEEVPKVEKSYQLDKLQTWEMLDEQTRVTMAQASIPPDSRCRKRTILLLTERLIWAMCAKAPASISTDS